MTKDTNKGFIHIILILIMVLVVLGLVGLNTGKIWTDLFYPLFKFIGNIILSIADFLTSIIKYLWQIVVQVGS